MSTDLENDDIQNEEGCTSSGENENKIGTRNNPLPKSEGRMLGACDLGHHLFLEQLCANVYVHIAIMRSSKLIEAEEVKEAWQIVTKYQVALQMRIVQEKVEGKCQYKFLVRENPFDIDMKVVPIQRESDWTGIVEKESAVTIDTVNGPLWKVILCPVEETGDKETPHQFVLIYKSHHVIADGLSVFDLIFRQFVSVLGAITNQKNTTDILPVLPLIKTNEDLFLTPQQVKNPLPWYMKMAIRMLRWKNRTFGFTKLPILCYSEDNFHPDEKTMETAFGTKPFSLDEEITSAVIRSAKSHKVTVHTVLVAIEGIALSTTAEDAGIKLPKNMKVAWPVDLRRFLGWKSPQTLGSLNGGGSSTVKSESKASVQEFWKSCKNIHSDIKRQTTKDKIPGMIKLSLMLSKLSEDGPLDQLMEDFGMDMVASISNLGRCDVGSEGNSPDGDVKIKISGHHFCLMSKFFFMVLLFNGISTSNGRFFWNICYNKLRVSDHFVESLIENTKHIMVKYCTENAE